MRIHECEMEKKGETIKVGKYRNSLNFSHSVFTFSDGRVSRGEIGRNSK